MSSCTSISIKQGNTPNIEVTLTDGEGDIFDLTNVTEITFQAKIDADSSAVIELKLSDAEIEKNDTTGVITLKFAISDTNSVTPGEYLPFLNLEIAP